MTNQSMLVWFFYFFIVLSLVLPIWIKALPLPPPLSSSSFASINADTDTHDMDYDSAMELVEESKFPNLLHPTINSFDDLDEKVEDDDDDDEEGENNDDDDDELNDEEEKEDRLNTNSVLVSTKNKSSLLSTLSKDFHPFKHPNEMKDSLKGNIVATQKNELEDGLNPIQERSNLNYDKSSYEDASDIESELEEEEADADASIETDVNLKEKSFTSMVSDDSLGTIHETSPSSFHKIKQPLKQVLNPYEQDSQQKEIVDKQQETEMKEVSNANALNQQNLLLPKKKLSKKDYEQFELEDPLD